MTRLAACASAAAGADDERTASTSGASRSARATCSRRRCRWRSVAQTIGNGGVRLKPHLMASGRRPRRAHRRRDRARGGRAGDLAPDRARADRDDEATSCARAPARRPRSRASRWPARPAPPSSTPERPQPAVVHRLHARAWRSRSRSSASRAARAARSPRRSPSSRPRGAGAVADAADRARHDGRRPLPDHRPDRLGRHGRRLLRRGHAARPPGRAQAALPPLRRGRRVRRALPPRGVERRRPAAPERRPGLRPRRVGRHLLHRDGVPRGPQPQADRARARRARARARGRPRRCRSSRPRASRTGAGSCTATSSRTT